MTLSEISTVLQLSVSPTIIISACGLILLSMTNRLGRAIDRSRVLAREWAAASEAFRANIERQLSVIRYRCRLIRSGILCVTLCILLTVALIILLFLSASAKFEAAWVVFAIFGGSMFFLLLSVGFFILDIFKSLEAMEAEVFHHLQKKGTGSGPA